MYIRNDQRADIKCFVNTNSAYMDVLFTMLILLYIFNIITFNISINIVDDTQ